MDSQSLPLANIDYLRYNTVIILPNRVAADEYLDTIYQYHTDCVIFACDGSYPADTTLRQAVESRIASDPKLSIIIFGAEAALSLNIKSQSILIMDDLIISDLYKVGITAGFGLELTPIKISTIVRSFSEQNKKLSIGNSLTEILKFRSIDVDRNPGLLKLITGNSSE